MGSELTVRQAEVLEAVRAFYDAQGVPPSIRVLAERLGISSSTAYQHLKALERKGYLQLAGSRGFIPVKERVS